MTAVAPGDSKGQGPPPAYPPPPHAAHPSGAPPPAYAYNQPGAPGYGQPTYGQPMAPGYHGASNVVIIGQPALGPQNGAGIKYYAHPATIICQHCSATVTTATAYSVGSYTWIIALIILLLGFWLGCCLIPFCVDGCKDVIHSCPNCQANVGRYSRL